MDGILQQEDIDDLFRQHDASDAVPDRRTVYPIYEEDQQTTAHASTRVTDDQQVPRQPAQPSMRQVRLDVYFGKSCPLHHHQEALHMALTMFQGKSSRKLPLRAVTAPAKRARHSAPEPAASPLQETYIDALRNALHDAPQTGSLLEVVAPRSTSYPPPGPGRAQRVKDALVQQPHLSEQHPCTPLHPARAVQRSLHPAFSVGSGLSETPVDTGADWLTTLLHP